LTRQRGRISSNADCVKPEILVWKVTGRLKGRGWRREDGLVCLGAGRWLSLVGGRSGRVLMGAGLVAAADQLAEGAVRWEDAYRGWVRAVEARDRVAGRMERKVTGVTGGLSVARFEAVCRRRSVRSVVEAEQKASAIRARPAVEATVAERDRAVAAADAAVLAARVVLAEASKVILGYGNAGPRLVGRSPVDLRRLARQPRRTMND